MSRLAISVTFIVYLSLVCAILYIGVHFITKFW